LTFTITCVHESVADVESYWDGLKTKPMMPDISDRSLVFSALLDVIGILIDEQQPEKLYMTTHSANLPPKALHKFKRIVAFCRERGFRGGRSDSFHGHWNWMMERVPVT
jgi:hypothetical protein